MKKEYVLFYKRQFQIGVSQVGLVRARTNQGAISRAGKFLKIKGKVSPEKFHQAGGIEITCRETVFPK